MLTAVYASAAVECWYQLILRERMAKFWASETERAAMVIQAAWRAYVARCAEEDQARAARMIQLAWRVKRRRLRAHR